MLLDLCRAIEQRSQGCAGVTGSGAGAKPRLSRGGAGRGEKPADDARTAEEASGRPPAGAVMRADMGPRDGKRSHWSGCGVWCGLGRGLGLDWRRPLHGGGRSYGGARLHGVARRILARQSGPELFRHRRQFRLGRSERLVHGRTEHHPAVRTPNADELTGRTEENPAEHLLRRRLQGPPENLRPEESVVGASEGGLAQSAMGRPINTAATIEK